jgi:hypothetical protein
MFLFLFSMSLDMPRVLFTEEEVRLMNSFVGRLFRYPIGNRYTQISYS